MKEICDAGFADSIFEVRKNKGANILCSGLQDVIKINFLVVFKEVLFEDGMEGGLSKRMEVVDPLLPVETLQEIQALTSRVSPGMVLVVYLMRVSPIVEGLK
jgi:hypothetical protein